MHESNALRVEYAINKDNEDMKVVKWNDLQMHPLIHSLW